MDTTAETIDRSVDYLIRQRDDAKTRLKCATHEGATLAGIVYAYMEDPQGVGLDALDAAYARFMTMHSGNFWPGENA